MIGSTISSSDYFANAGRLKMKGVTLNFIHATVYASIPSKDGKSEKTEESLETGFQLKAAKDYAIQKEPYITFNNKKQVLKGDLFTKKGDITKTREALINGHIKNFWLHLRVIHQKTEKFYTFHKKIRVTVDKNRKKFKLILKIVPPFGI